MASCRIAWLMNPPRLEPLPPFRPCGGAFGPVAADVPAPHCAISDRVAAREGFCEADFYGCLPGPCDPGGASSRVNLGEPASAVRDRDLLPAAKRRPFGS